jgi:hypothetical protein
MSKCILCYFTCLISPNVYLLQIQTYILHVKELCPRVAQMLSYSLHACKWGGGGGSLKLSSSVIFCVTSRPERFVLCRNDRDSEFGSSLQSQQGGIGYDVGNHLKEEKRENLNLCVMSSLLVKQLAFQRACWELF